MSPQLRIGEVARLLGVSTKTIRHYHTLGLLPEPPRANNGYRQYDAAALIALRRIQRLQTAGLTLRQVQRVLAAANPERTTTELVEQQLRAVEAALQTLEQRRQRLHTLMAEENALEAALSTPTLLPDWLEQALGALPLPAHLRAVDLTAFREVAAYAWPTEVFEAWQAELMTLLRHPELLVVLTPLAELLAHADELNDQQFQARVDRVKSLLTQLPQGQEQGPLAALSAQLAHLARQGQVTPRQAELLRRLQSP